MAWTRNKYFTLIVNVCRLVLSLVLVVSGLVKAFDPIGSMYKLKEYANLFVPEVLGDDTLLMLGIAQAVFEFLLGIFLFMGVYRKMVAYLAPVAMLFFTIVTAVIYFNGGIEDCGCFGEVVVLSNGETLAKNLFLLVMSLLVMLGRKRFVFHISAGSRWMVTLFSLFYIGTVIILSLSHLPVVDSGRYSVGTDLYSMTQGTPDEYRVVYVYEHEGDTCEMPEGEIPDSTWVNIGMRSELVKEGVPPLIEGFSVVDWENDNDVTEALLSDTGYVCLVAIERVESAEVSRVDKINDMYDYCVDKGVPFYVVTASGDEEVELWRKRTGAEYSMYWSDEQVIREMIRCNPGLLLLKNGVIVGKWNVSDLPVVERLAASPTGMPDGLASLVGRMQGWRFWLLVLVVPLLFISLFDAVTFRKSVSATDNTDENESLDK
ncbi:MAG: DoxX family membrane protein [Bacteroidaceae bacterium]|nr:DoxX family membrane protein [Bacteroidaceae bacterium]